MTTQLSRVEACCAVLYGDPLVELLAGDSLHPGGLASSRRLLEAAALPRGRRILDAGCGLGAGARLAALEYGLVVDACDVSVEAIGRARTRADGSGSKVRFEVASVLALPYPDGSFAAALVECVLSTTDATRALGELRRVLGPEGRLLVSDVHASARPDIPEPLASVLCLTRAWRPSELEDLVGSTGFSIERVWDESPAVAAFIDRIGARAGLLRALMRDHPGMTSIASPAREAVRQLGGDARLDDVLDAARRLVDRGQIGYRALVARVA